MKKNRITLISFITVCLLLLTLVGGSTSIAGEPDRGPIATVKIEPGVISWEAQAENGGLVLTIAGPGDWYLRQEYPSGAHPTFKPVDGWGKALPDGVYNYELLLLPAKVEVPTEYDESQRGLAPPKSSGEALVQSGSFSILNGGFVTQDAVEGGDHGEDTAQWELADIVHADDVIITGSLCTGFDCVTDGTENFGFDTIKLKENNLRIKFEDTSSTAGFASNDWQITANDSASGGANRFSIDDIDHGKTPFTIEAGAPSNSLYVDDYGNVGFGTSTPVLELHVKDSDTPSVRLEQDSSGGWTAQTWDVAGNESNFFIRDTTNGSKLPFRIQPNTPTNTLCLKSGGRVGIGTWSPEGLFHVQNTAPDPDVNFIVTDDGKVGIGTTGPNPLLAIGGAGNAANTVAVYGTKQQFAMYETDNSNYSWEFEVNNGQFRITDRVVPVTRLAIATTGNVGIGTTGPAYKLDVAGSAHASSFPTSSDARFKTNVTQLTDVLEKLEKVRGVSFDWNDLYESLGRSTGHREIGVIAQEVEAVFPELVTTWGDEDYRAVDYGRLTGVLIEAVKELRAEKDAEIAAMKQQNADLEERVAALEALVTSLVQGGTE